MNDNEINEDKLDKFMKRIINLVEFVDESPEGKILKARYGEKLYRKLIIAEYLKQTTNNKI